MTSSHLESIRSTVLVRVRVRVLLLLLLLLDVDLVTIALLVLVVVSHGVDRILEIHHLGLVVLVLVVGLHSGGVIVGGLAGSWVEDGDAFALTVHVTLVVVGLVVSAAHLLGVCSAVVALVVLRTSSLGVDFAVVFAGALALVFVGFAVHSANRQVEVGAGVAVVLPGAVLLFLRTPSQTGEPGLVALHLAEVVVILLVFAADGNQDFGTVFAALQERRAFSVSEFDDSHALHQTLVVVGSSIDSANRLILHLAFAGTLAGFVFGSNLHDGVQNAARFEIYAQFRADRVELHRTVYFKGVALVSMGRPAFSRIGEIDVTSFTTAVISIGYTVLSATRIVVVGAILHNTSVLAHCFFAFAPRK